MELNCTVQTYDWGRRGSKSIVARLAKAAKSDFVLDNEKPYAELWMGTHQNGPSCLKKDGTLLGNYIADEPHVLGVDKHGKTFNDLPFLFKVLSVGKPLSVQAHPDKEMAEKLHSQRPDVYKDANHKPELAIALSPLEAFFGFRPLAEIVSYIAVVPELRAVIGVERLESKLPENFVKNCFQTMLNREPEAVANLLNSLLDRLSKEDASGRKIQEADMVERLHKNFPGDVCCFGIYFFNYLQLKPGEAIYIPANEPHAYLSGDCIECMARSDNVVRAGLTPKPKDVPTLMEMLTFSCMPHSCKLFQPLREDEFTEVFRPPVPDFAVARITITSERDSYDLIPRSTASILLIVTGKAEIASSISLKPGTVIFISANERIRLQLSSNPIIMFQAFANVSV